MTATKYFKEIKKQLIENDNYNSAFEADLPDEQEQSDLLSAPVDEVDTKTTTEKDKLTKKIVDKLKKSLVVSDELQSLLNEIDKINKSTGVNEWKANPEKNTASLDSKDAQIFRQNDNICLSMNGQVHLFKTVDELHNFLKEHNFPLPQNISLHEAAIKGNLKADIDAYIAQTPVNKYSDDAYDLPLPRKSSREEYIAQNKKDDNSVFRVDDKMFITKADGSKVQITPEKPVEECGVTSASLGAPVQYTASPDEKLNEEEELTEKTPASIGFVGDLISDPTGKQILGYGEPGPGQARWVDVDQKVNPSRADRPWLKYVLRKERPYPGAPSKITFNTDADPNFWTNAHAFLNHNGAKNSELSGSLWDTFWEEYMNRNPNSKGYGRFITTPEDLETASSYLTADGVEHPLKATLMTKEKLASIAQYFKELGIGNLYGEFDPEDPELLNKLIVMKLRNQTNKDIKVSPHIEELKSKYYNARKDNNDLRKHATDTDYLSRFLADNPGLEKTHAGQNAATTKIQPVMMDEPLEKKRKQRQTIAKKLDTRPSAPKVSVDAPTKSTAMPDSNVLLKKYKKQFDSGEVPHANIGIELAQKMRDYANNEENKEEWNIFIDTLIADGQEGETDIDEPTLNYMLPNLKFKDVSFESTSFGDTFLNMQKNNEVELKEDDTPADFATGQSAAPAMDMPVDNTMATGTDTAADPSMQAQTPDLGMDPTQAAGAGTPQFGDIQINANGYSPEEAMDPAQAPMPAPDMPEYKIIDVLVNDQDIHDIKVKVKDKKTGEISTKDLSEIDV